MSSTSLISNRYRILETIARGGFGETYLVEDLHLPSGRKCVLKQLKPVVEKPKISGWIKERFQIEAATLEELGSANQQIPELYAYFSEGEQFYLVQEWVQGETLAQQWQRKGNFSEQEVVDLLTKTLPILDFIHSRKIIHRDLKPDNLIIRSQDNLPVLIDFGAVKETMSTIMAEPQSVSKMSAVIGTPGYMPSEQAAGRPVYSSDLYSLGLTAIFLLTGNSPQDLEIDANSGEFIWQDPSLEISPELQGLLSRAIRFHPRDRFSQARDMLAALHNIYQTGNRQKVPTTATVKVAPAFKNNGTSFAGTLAYNQTHNRVRNRQKQKPGFLNRVFWFFLITGGITLGTFAASLYALNNWWQGRQEAISKTQVEPKPKIVLSKPDKESTSPTQEENTIRISDLFKKDQEPNLEKEDKAEQNSTSEQTGQKPKTEVPTKKIPDVFVQAKTQNQAKSSLPIFSTGITERELLSTLGQPSTSRSDFGNNGKILIYQDQNSTNTRFTYYINSKGTIRQANIALSQDLSLVAMQESMAKLLGVAPSVDAKNKLRNVYDRKASLQSFSVQRLKGSIRRDSKNRVNISVWENNS